MRTPSIVGVSVVALFFWVCFGSFTDLFTVSMHLRLLHQNGVIAEPADFFLHSDSQLIAFGCVVMGFLNFALDVLHLVPEFIVNGVLQQCVDDDQCVILRYFFLCFKMWYFFHSGKQLLILPIFDEGSFL
jgi:hypothetical protein